MRAIAGMSRIPGVRALGAEIAGRRREAMERAYMGQLCWMAAALLHAQGGGGEFPMPGWLTLFPLAGRENEPTAEEIRQRVLTQLATGDEGGME